MLSCVAGIFTAVNALAFAGVVDFADAFTAVNVLAFIGVLGFAGLIAILTDVPMGVSVGGTCVGCKLSIITRPSL